MTASSGRSGLNSERIAVAFSSMGSDRYRGSVSVTPDSSARFGPSLGFELFEEIADRGSKAVDRVDAFEHVHAIGIRHHVERLSQIDEPASQLNGVARDRVVIVGPVHQEQSALETLRRGQGVG